MHIKLHSYRDCAGLMNFHSAYISHHLLQKPLRTTVRHLISYEHFNTCCASEFTESNYQSEAFQERGCKKLNECS